MPQEKSIPYSVLSSAFVMGFAMYAPMAGVPPMEHILREELLITHAQVSLLFIVPLIMLVALSIPGGLLTDRIGIRKAAGIGAIIIVVGTLLRSIAIDFPTLLAFTVIYGTGFGLVWPNLPKLISVWVPREKAVMATGIFTAGMATGIALPVAITVPVIYPVANTFQGTFFIWAIPTIAATILWWILVKDPPHSRTPRESLGRSGVPFRQVLQNKNLWLVAILLSLNNFFMFTWVGWSPALMMQKGATPDLAALIASVYMWVVIPSVFFIPRLSYKLGVRKPFIWISSFILAFVSLEAIFMTVPMGWVLMALAGIVNSTRFVTIMALPVEMMPKKIVGVASGLILSIGYIGAIIGPLIGGHLFDLTGSLDFSLLVLIGASIITGSIALKIPETGSKPKPEK